MNGIVVDSMEMVAHSAVSWTELTLDWTSNAIITHMATVILVAGASISSMSGRVIYGAY